MSWDPAQYLKFGNQRLRPALDLLAQIPLDAPAAAVDLGCGPGNVTRFIAQRWPGARVTGVDNSADMLAQARVALPQADWVESGIGAWAPDHPVDLIYSNAALHWLPDHRRLLERLLGFLNPGGVLAVQMPRNWAAPSHTSIDAALDGLDLTTAQRAAIDAAKLNTPVSEPAQYYDWLKPLTAHIDMWETLYTHVLAGENAVAEWVKGTALIPVMNGLKALGDKGSGGNAAENGLHQWFWDDYCAKTNAAYPRRADGTTLLQFRRLFFVATKS
jgi:trans-aconitate 2-methyltransferase